jgi:hypothetical protein
MRLLVLTTAYTMLLIATPARHKIVLPSKQPASLNAEVVRVRQLTQTRLLALNQRGCRLASIDALLRHANKHH